MREFFASLLFPASALAAVMAWQEQFEWGIKILAGLAAIACGVAGFIHHRAKTHELKSREHLSGKD